MSQNEVANTEGNWCKFPCRKNFDLVSMLLALFIRLNRGRIYQKAVLFPLDEISSRLFTFL